MKEIIIIYLPYIISGTTLYGMYLLGSKNIKAWDVLLLNQLLWLIWILTTGSYGLIPMNIGLWIIYIKNYITWNKKLN